MLTRPMVELISTYTVGSVATVQADGAPAVSPKATFLVIDDRTIAFANIRSEGTVENLRHDPRVEVTFVDIFKRLGCRVRGRARYDALHEVKPEHAAPFEAKWSDLYELMKGIITIDIVEAQNLSSPSYDVGGNQSEMEEYWMTYHADVLGFDLSKKGA